MAKSFSQMKWIPAFVLLFSLQLGFSQSFELVGREESVRGGMGQTLQIPIKIKNTSGQSQFYIVRKVRGDLSSSQKGYFCLGVNCLTEELSQSQISKRIEPGETIDNLVYTLETGMISGNQNFIFEIFPRGFPEKGVEYSVSLTIEEESNSGLVFKSKEIVINDVYPNPVTDQAYVDYTIQDPNVDAKLIIHNILGRSMGEYELSPVESRLKLATDDLVTGVYFYTVYLDNKGVVTRKLIVRK